MRGDNQNDTRAELLSAFQWWQDAGADVLVDDSPRDWLRAAPAPTIVEAQVPAPALPDTLAGFHRWLAEADVPLAGPPAARLMPGGEPASGLMVITDLPEIGDDAAGALLSGPGGRLFDRMLGAIGRDRASIYLASLSVTRTPDGRIDRRGYEALAPIALHHIALVRPRCLLLLGDCVASALLGHDLSQARSILHDLNHDDGKVTAVTTFHPRFLMQHGAFKADAWRDLRLLLGELSR